MDTESQCYLTQNRQAAHSNSHLFLSVVNHSLSDESQNTMAPCATCVHTLKTQRAAKMLWPNMSNFHPHFMKTITKQSSANNLACVQNCFDRPWKYCTYLASRCQMHGLPSLPACYLPQASPPRQFK